VFKGIDKKRHTRAPYEIHTLEGMIKKNIPMLSPRIPLWPKRPGGIFKGLK